MKISLSDRRSQFPRMLAELQSQPLSYEDATQLPENVTATVVELSEPAELSKLGVNFLFEYRIFPQAIMTFLGEWQVAGRPTMREGDVILQQVNVPPGGQASLRLLFGVRVLEIINSENEIGFVYGTLAGHVERGTSKFAVSLPTPHQVQLTIQSFSEPAIAPARWTAPLFARPYQDYCTHRALSAMSEQFRRANPTCIGAAT